MTRVAVAALVVLAAVPASAQSISGSSQELGPFTYYNYTVQPPPDYSSIYRTEPTWPTTITGNSQQLGPFRYDSWHLGNGQTVNCTTQRLGTFTYTNCY